MERPSAQPVLQLKYVPIHNTRNAAIAKAHKILSSNASFILSMRGGIYGSGF